MTFPKSCFHGTRFTCAMSVIDYCHSGATTGTMPRRNVWSTSPRSACEPIESAFSVRIGGGYFVRRTSERDDFSSNRQPAVSFCLSMTFFGKLAPTFPGHALITNIPIGCCCRGFGAATHDVCVIVFHEIQESHFSRVRTRRILPLDVTAYGVDVLS